MPSVAQPVLSGHQPEPQPSPCLWGSSSPAGIGRQSQGGNYQSSVGGSYIQFTPPTNRATSPCHCAINEWHHLSPLGEHLMTNHNKSLMNQHSYEVPLVPHWEETGLKIPYLTSIKSPPFGDYLRCVLHSWLPSSLGDGYFFALSLPQRRISIE